MPSSTTTMGEVMGKLAEVVVSEKERGCSSAGLGGP